MEDTKHIKISEFNYPLPDERIAKFPLATRDQSKLLVYRHGEVSEDIFTSLPHYLESGELMIFNNTKVIQARLISFLVAFLCLTVQIGRDGQFTCHFQQELSSP